MNPYLEQESVWQDFHSTYIPALRELLTQSIAPNYFVKVEEFVFIHELPADQRRPIGRADVALGPLRQGAAVAGQVQVHPAPFRTYLPAVATEKEPHSYLSVRDRASRTRPTTRDTTCSEHPCRVDSRLSARPGKAVRLERTGNGNKMPENPC